MSETPSGAADRLGGSRRVNERGQGRGVLPLAGAAERLRRPPGRPRKAQGIESAPAPQAGAPAQDIDSLAARGAPVPGLCPVTPRLLDSAGAAQYLGVSQWTIRDLDAAGHLPRVRLPLPGGKDLRKLLYDRTDLDRLIDNSKDIR